MTVGQQFQLYMQSQMWLIDLSFMLIVLRCEEEKQMKASFKQMFYSSKTEGDQAQQRSLSPCCPLNTDIKYDKMRAG